MVVVVVSHVVFSLLASANGRLDDRMPDQVNGDRIHEREYNHAAKDRENQPAAETRGVYIMLELQIEHGAEPRNASLPEGGRVTKLAATNASASLHRQRRMAQTHHGQNHQNGVSAREVSDLIFGKKHAGGCRQQRAEDQKHRNVHEIM